MKTMSGSKIFDFSLEPLKGKVLSIQSHVVHGYVGNKASSAVLQFLGYEVKSINSVHFCNHSGYPSCCGTKMNGSQLKEIFNGLKKNNLLEDITHIQTGYIGTKEFLLSLIDVVQEMRKINPKIIYLCDPVLGDVVLRNGILKKEIYVPEELVKIYREKVVQQADVITPNQMEAELISGIEIKNENDVKRAIECIHGTMGVKIVVITSCELEEEGILALYASRWNGRGRELLRIDFERKKGYFSGVGDVIASLILAWTKFEDYDFIGGIEKAFNTVQCMVENTESGEELKVIQCRKIVVEPMIVYKAKKIL